MLKFPTKIHNNPELVQLLKKRDIIVETETSIHQNLLTFPLTLGGQQLNAVVDTGSRSTWIYDGVNDSSNVLCSSDSCVSSLDEITVSSDDYAIYYRGDFSASGKWSSAQLQVGNSKAVDFKFGLATSITGSTGGFSWAGFGYNSDELDMESSTHILDSLYEGGAIDKRIFQLEYSDFSNWDKTVMGNGLLTIGGYNSDKDFKFFDMIENIKYYLAIPMESMSNSNGDSIKLNNSGTVAFDSGSTSLLMKDSYKNAILGDVKFDDNYPSFFKCSDYENFKVDFQIDSTTTISLPLTDLSWNNYQDSYDLCQLMVGSLSDDVDFEVVLGQYALKNLVVAFDIDNKQLGIATNSTDVN